MSCDHIHSPLPSLIHLSSPVHTFFLPTIPILVISVVVCGAGNHRLNMRKTAAACYIQKTVSLLLPHQPAFSIFSLILDIH